MTDSRYRKREAQRRAEAAVAPREPLISWDSVKDEHRKNLRRKR